LAQDKGIIINLGNTNITSLTTTISNKQLTTAIPYV